MTSQQSADQKLPMMFKGQPLFKPAKDNPTEAEKFVRSIYKHKPNNLDLVAAELTPLFGFGPGSNHDVIARSKSQALFASQVMEDPFGEFAMSYLKGEWALPMASWDLTIELVKKHGKEKAWIESKCPISDTASVDEFYARFLIRSLQQLRYPEKPLKMLDWLRNADEEDSCWVLFHALMYLQLEAMHFNRTHAPFRDLVSHYVNKMTGAGSFFDHISKLMALRRRKE
ncbi:hypothetical protein F4782DRAFT_545358 [Xylaria castorea]|nr:hypothetical protein F4782DRAFT_545358 [Xylaria castorea]